MDLDLLYIVTQTLFNIIRPTWCFSTFGYVIIKVKNVWDVLKTCFNHHHSSFVQGLHFCFWKAPEALKLFYIHFHWYEHAFHLVYKFMNHNKICWLHSSIASKKILRQFSQCAFLWKIILYSIGWLTSIIFCSWLYIFTAGCVDGLFLFSEEESCSNASVVLDNCLVRGLKDSANIYDECVSKF